MIPAADEAWVADELYDMAYRLRRPEFIERVTRMLQLTSHESVVERRRETRRRSRVDRLLTGRTQGET